MQRNKLKLEQFKGITAIIIALFILACSPIFIKLLEGELSSSATIFNRLLGGAIIFGLVRGLSRSKNQKVNSSSAQEVTKKDYLLFFAAGLFFWGTQTAWAWSLPRISVAISSLLHNFTPIFVILASWLIKRQRFNLQFVIGTALSIMGSCLLGMEHLSHASVQIQGDIAAIVSAILWAAYMVAVETLCHKFSTVTIMFGVCTIGTILSIPILLMTGMQWFPLSFQGWVFAVSSVLVMVLGQGFFLYGVERLGGSLAAVLLLMDPLLSTIPAWLIFSEILSDLDWVVMAIVLLGVYFAISSRFHTPALELHEEIAA